MITKADIAKIAHDWKIHGFKNARSEAAIQLHALARELLDGCNRSGYDSDQLTASILERCKDIETLNSELVQAMGDGGLAL